MAATEAVMVAEEEAVMAGERVGAMVGAMAAAATAVDRVAVQVEAMEAAMAVATVAATVVEGYNADHSLRSPSHIRRDSAGSHSRRLDRSPITG